MFLYCREDEATFRRSGKVLLLQSHEKLDIVRHVEGVTETLTEQVAAHDRNLVQKLVVFSADFGQCPLQTRPLKGQRVILASHSET